MDYRVHVPRMTYRGSDRRKLEKQRHDASLCVEIEAVLQRQYDEIKPGEIRSILSHEVAWEIGADSEKVRRIMCRIQGGSNGVTFSKAPLPGQPWEYERKTEETTEHEKMPSEDMTADSRLKLQDRVRHGKFGEGFVVHILEERVTVEFENGGRKRVIASFLEPLTD